MATPTQLRYITQQAQRLGLDPNAVLAIAGHEGLSGGVGDNGTSFGPFQLHKGGALPAAVPLATANQWAWSPQGIDYALGKINSVAHGLKGRAAVSAISTQFERPADPNAEIADAMAHYGMAAPASKTPPAQNATNPSTSALSATLDVGGSQARRALAAMLMGSGKVDFNSNQVQVPNLVQLANLRQQLTDSTSAPPSPTAAASDPRGGPSAAPTAARTGNPVVDLTSVGGEHQTEGLAGYPAKDYFAPSGSPAVAPVTGKVVKLSGHDPSQGPIEGPHGPLGWSVYIQGSDGHTYYLTHMGSRSVQLGQTVKAGQPIGTVADYAKYGTPSHIHMGVH